MKKARKCLAVSLAVAMLITSMIPVSAGQKKLKVNTVYNTAKKVKGKTKKRYLVRVKIGKKTYKKKADKKGYFSVTIPKQKTGKKLTVKVYKKKNKKWKLYTKKTVTVKKKSKKVATNTTKKNKYPGKEDPIDLDQVNKDIASGKHMNKGQSALGAGHYYYIVNTGNCSGTALIGYVNDYIKVDTDGETVTLKALNGATLYYTAAGDGEKSLLQLEEPTEKSKSLKPGQKATFTCYDYNAEDGDLYLKVKAYKNDKLIALSYNFHYMIKPIALR